MGHDAGMGLWDRREAIVVHRVDRCRAEPVRRAWAECLLTERGWLRGRRGSLVPVINAAGWRTTARTLAVTLRCADNCTDQWQVGGILSDVRWAAGATLIAASPPA